MDALCEQVSRKVNAQYERLRNFFLNQEAVILRGKYAGRRAQIQGVILYHTMRNGYQPAFLAPPYRLTGDTADFLNDAAARTYWPRDYFELAED